MNRRRLRKFILITGTALCLLIATASVASGWWEAYLNLKDGPLLGLSAGLVYFSAEPGRGPNPGWIKSRDELAVVWWPRYPIKWEPNRHTIACPLWLLLATVAIPTLLVWRLAPKFPRGHCRRCGYNLKGLTEARCPECGQTFA